MTNESHPVDRLSWSHSLSMGMSNVSRDRFVSRYTHVCVYVCWHLIGLKCTCHAESNVFYMGRRDWSAISFQCIHSNKMPFRDQSPMHISDLRLSKEWYSITHRRGSLINLPFARESKRRRRRRENCFNGWIIPEGEENDRKSNCLCHSSKTAHSQTNRKGKRRRWCLFNYFLINLLIGNVGIVCLRSDWREEAKNERNKYKNSRKKSVRIIGSKK